MSAFAHQMACVKSVLQLLQTMNATNWPLPVLHTVCIDLRLLAQKADSSQISESGEMLAKAAKMLMKCFSVCANDKR